MGFSNRENNTDIVYSIMARVPRRSSAEETAIMKQRDEMRDQWAKQNEEEWQQLVLRTTNYLDDEQKGRAEEFLKRYKDEFEETLLEAGGAKVEFKHKVVLKEGAIPVAKRPYRASAEQEEAINAELRKLYARGAIRPSTSLWAAPVVMVKKPNGRGWRFTVDMRGINEWTLPDPFPIQSVDEMLTKLGNSWIFSSFDATSAYWCTKPM